MGRLYTTILIFCLFMASACGYRTAPVPYSQADEKLPVVSQLTLRQQGSDWVFHWNLSDETLLTPPPEEKEPDPGVAPDPGTETESDTNEKPVPRPRIRYFQLNLYRSADSCPACLPKPVGNLSIDVDTGDVKSHFEEALQIDPAGSRFYTKPEGILTLYLPAVFFLENRLVNGSYFTVDYTLDSGVKSLSSEPIYPRNIKTVPAPQIHARKSVRTTETGTETALLVQWQPRQESLRHTLQKDGKISESIIHFGINLYRLSPENRSEEPILINPRPLLYGRFSLLNVNGQLLARQVDQFGNESEPVIVFDGQHGSPTENNNEKLEP